MKIRVQQKDGQIAEIWLGDHHGDLTVYEKHLDDVDELAASNNGVEFSHYFDKDGYLLPEQYKRDEENIVGTVKVARIYIPPYKVKQ